MKTLFIIWIVTSTIAAVLMIVVSINSWIGKGGKK